MAAATPSRPTGSIMGFFSKGKTIDPFKTVSEQALDSAPRPTSAKSAASHPGSAGSAAASSDSGPRTAQAASRIQDTNDTTVVNQMADPLYTRSQAVIGKSLTIVSLGHLSSTSSPFVTELGIFPVGYQATREYNSYKLAGAKTLYTFSIQAGAAPNTIQFAVSAADDAANTCVASTPAAAWKLVKERLEAAGSAMKSKKAAAWWFGLKEASVALALQGMPGIPGSAFVLKGANTAASKKRGPPRVVSTSSAAPATAPPVVTSAPAAPQIIHAGAVNIILDDPSQEIAAQPVAADLTPESALLVPAVPAAASPIVPVDEDGDADLTAETAEGTANTDTANTETDPSANESDVTPERAAQKEAAAAAPAAAAGGDAAATAGAAAAAAFASIPAAATAPAPTTTVLAASAQAAVPSVVVEWFIPTALVPACIATVHGQHATKKDLAHACAAACPGATLKALRSTISSITMQISDKALGLKRAWCVRQSVLDAVGVKLAHGAVPAVADPGVTARAAPGVDEVAQAAAAVATATPAAAAAAPASPAAPAVADPRFAEYVEQLRSKCNLLQEEHSLGIAVNDGTHPSPLRLLVPGGPSGDISALAAAVTAPTGDEDALKRKVALDAFVAIVGHGSPCESVQVTAQAMQALLQQHCPSDEGASVPAAADFETVVSTALTWRSVTGSAQAAPGVCSDVAPVAVAIGYWEAPAALLKAASKDAPKELYEDVRDCGEALRTALSTVKALLRVTALLGGTPEKVAAAEGNGKLAAAQADLLRKQEAEAAKAAARSDRLEKRAAAEEAAAAKEAEAAARKAAAAEEKEAKKLKKAGVSSAQQKIMASFFGGPPPGAARSTPSKPRAQAPEGESAGATPIQSGAAAPADVLDTPPAHKALVRVTESEEDAARRSATTARLDAAYAAAQEMSEELLQQSQAALLADMVARGRASRRAASVASRLAKRQQLRSQLRAVVVDAPIDDLLCPPANTAAVPAAGGGEAETAAPAWAGGKVLKHAAGAGAIQLPGEEQRLLVPAHFGRPKLLHFSADRRPPYWGTWSKQPVGATLEGGVDAASMPPLKGPDAMPATLQDGSAAWYVEPTGSARVGALAPRRPLACDTRLFDYMVDSEAEWESEDEDAEDLASDEDEEEDEEEDAVAPVGTAAGYDYQDGFMALDTVVHYAAGGQEDDEGDVALDGAGSPSANPVRGGVKRPREGPSSDGGSAPKCARVLTGLAASIAQASGDASGVGGATGKRVLKFGVVHDVSSHAQAGNDTAKKLAPILRPMAGAVTSFVRPSVCLQYSQEGAAAVTALPRFSLPSFEPARVFGKVKVRKTGDVGAKGAVAPGVGRGQTHFPTEPDAVESLKAVMRANNRPYEKVADLWMAQHGPQWAGTTCASVRRAVLQLGKREKGQNKPWHLHGEPAPVVPPKAAKPSKPAAAAAVAAPSQSAPAPAV